VGQFPITTNRELAQSSFLYIQRIVWVSLRLPVALRCAEELLQFREDFLGTFFLQEMAAIETVPRNR